MLSAVRTAIVFLFAALCFWPGDSFAQRQFTDYQDVEGTIRIGPGEDYVIDRTERGYTLLLPEGNGRSVHGLVVVLKGKRHTLDDISEPMKLYPHAFRENLGVLYVSSGNPVDFYFKEQNMRRVLGLIEEARQSHGLTGTALFYAGMSIEGTRALKLTVFCKKHPYECDLVPDAIAINDSPLDMKRFWHVTQRAENLQFHDAAAGEGVWVSYHLKRGLGGTPKQKPTAYAEYSPYIYTWENTRSVGGPNVKYLKDIPLRAYIEPDVNWWIENRRQGYYSMNVLDMAGLVNALKTRGGEKAKLISTREARSDPQESPHTWGIVDNAELMEWFASRVQ